MKQEPGINNHISPNTSQISFQDFSRSDLLSETSWLSYFSFFTTREGLFCIRMTCPNRKKSYIQLQFRIIALGDIIDVNLNRFLRTHVVDDVLLSVQKHHRHRGQPLPAPQAVYILTRTFDFLIFAARRSQPSAAARGRPGSRRRFLWRRGRGSWADCRG